MVCGPIWFAALVSKEKNQIQRIFWPQVLKRIQKAHVDTHHKGSRVLDVRPDPSQICPFPSLPFNAQIIGAAVPASETTAA